MIIVEDNACGSQKYAKQEHPSLPEKGIDHEKKSDNSGIDVSIFRELDIRKGMKNVSKNKKRKKDAAGVIIIPSKTAAFDENGGQKKENGSDKRDEGANFQRSTDKIKGNKA